MTPSERANRATELFASDVWTEAFTELKASLHAQWEASPADNTRERERIYDRLQALMDMQAQLQTFQFFGAPRKEPRT